MKLCDELIEKFAIEIEDGLPFVYACDLFGISFVTFQNWMKQGETDRDVMRDSIECRFFKSIKCAYAKYIKKAKKKIRNGDERWAGEAWWLERTNKMFVLNRDENISQETVIVNPSIKPNHREIKNEA